jgi:hypothetical protein
MGPGEGEAGVPFGASRAAVLAVGLLAALLLCAARAGLAQAACDTSWTGSASDQNWFSQSNWDHGVPTSATNACIDNPATEVDIVGAGAHAESLELSGGTLKIAGFNDGATSHIAFLSLADGGSIKPNASVLLTATCAGQGCTAGGTAELTNSSLSMPVTNAGTIKAAPGSDNGLHARELNGNLTNTGIIDIGTNTVLDDGLLARTLDNQGQISVENAPGARLTLNPTTNSTIINDAGGSITNNGGSGSLSIDSSDTFTQAGGTTDPATATPGDPAVILDNSQFQTPPTLSYAGTGMSSVEALGTVNLNGNLAPGQNLVIDGTSGGCVQTLVTAASGFTNAGSITLTGSGCSGLKLSSGTLTNSGTLTMDPTGPGVTRELRGSLTNSGTLNVNGATAFDQPAATLTQTGGSTTIAPGALLDTSVSSATFELQGGVLTGGGQHLSPQNESASINGPVDNTGGNIIPGSTMAPGLMTFDGAYTQGPGGTLTEVVDGPGGSTGVGTAYSELASTDSITLGGTLAIRTVANPAVDDLDTILAANGTLSGTFSGVTGQFSSGWTFGYQPTYGSNYAALEVGARLALRKTGPGSGTISSSPSGINCGADCAALFFGDATVTLSAHPAGGSAFGGWSGACTGSASTCQVTMSQARTVSARFLHATATSLASSLNPARVGRRVTYTAAVSPDPTGGTVRFTSNGSPISGCGAVPVSRSTGKATCSVTYHSRGSRKLRATYSGNNGFGRSASPTLTETVS